jgi:dihydroorotate dehydrogenase (NAD+) catalytic subunit
MPKYDFGLSQPIINAAGSLGFVPDRGAGIDSSRFGAFITNPVSLGPRSPAQGQRYASFTGGFLLHTGYPNPGLSSVLHRFKDAWARAPLPVIVHILGQNPEEAATAVRRLEGLEGVIGIELGLPPKIETAAAQKLVAAAAGELQLIVRLPFEQALELAPSVIAAGAAAVSLGAPRGSLPASGGGIIEGRLYGPGIFPLALQIVRELVQLDLPGVMVIGGGGVYSDEQAQAMLDSGAAAVQMDTVLWKV